jgi:predicted Zn-dependent protease
VIGAHTSNVTSGDFAVELENTFLIENGEIKNSIKQGILVGNIFQLLKRIDLVGNNSRQVSAIITPSFRIKGMEVIS